LLQAAAIIGDVKSIDALLNGGAAVPVRRVLFETPFSVPFLTERQMRSRRSRCRNRASPPRPGRKYQPNLRILSTTTSI
jgi:hypothetical protein